MTPNQLDDDNANTESDSISVDSSPIKVIASGPGDRYYTNKSRVTIDILIGIVISILVIGIAIFAFNTFNMILFMFLYPALFFIHLLCKSMQRTYIVYFTRMLMIIGVIFFVVIMIIFGSCIVMLGNGSLNLH